MIRCVLVNPSHNKIFRDFVYLGRVFRAISVSSADAERLISKLGAIKEEHRATLSQNYLEMSLYLLANGPDLEDADDLLTRAIMFFFGRKNRRVIVPGTRDESNVQHAKALCVRCK